MRGTAIIIKNNIRLHELNNFKSDFLQTTTVKVEDCSGFLLLHLYIALENIQLLAKFEVFFEIRFIAIGDYNAKFNYWESYWGSRLANPKDRAFHKTINKQRNIISQSMPTYWPTDQKKVPDIIEFGVIKDIAEHTFQLKQI